MYDRKHNERSPASALALALTEAFPETSYAAIPSSEYGLAAETFQAFDDGTLAEAPYALDAWLDQQQHALL